MVKPVFKFFKKNVLIISPEEWDYIKVSKHHYAEILASKNNQVYFLNPPDKKVNGIACKGVAENLFVVDYKDPYTGVRFLPKAARKYLNRRLYNRIQEAAATRFDIVILFENSRFYDLDFLPKEVLSIYFQVDEDQNFHPGKAARSADIVIAINDTIQNILSVYRTPVFKIPHGFTGNFSKMALQIIRDEAVYQKHNRRIKAYYVGNLDNGFVNTKLLAVLIGKKQEVDFVLVGPYSTEGDLYQLVKRYKNVQFLGKLPANSIPALLDEADLLFFAYTEEFVSSSHKVMEYLASGKAIVTTKAEGYPEDPELIYRSGTAEKFVCLFSKVCANIEEANSVDRMKKRIQFAKDNTYEARIVVIENLVNGFFEKQNGL